ncbi:hypothetical protein ASPVEDRAFT_27220 [Aspergillus versicolor CBS 583.65]|uniref:Uncharacterized protein n=1 Tax=Aspergillus versicolor CBS 583.65 TaxID=1036611 RepID=A0A1L9PG52_ASPVE|nr:uncharacterized protein ASPVEDRAFT_27220 [Aspergillus versicolor CBS 583.65]OJJ00498.1 hypothetical protein ASPVEDRAFT_27220 [Aspergillus versicolor CBS 583.65]
MDQSHTPMRGDVAGEEPPRSMDMLQGVSRKNRKKKNSKRSDRHHRPDFDNSRALIRCKATGRSRSSSQEELQTGLDDQASWGRSFRIQFATVCQVTDRLMGPARAQHWTDEKHSSGSAAEATHERGKEPTGGAQPQTKATTPAEQGPDAALGSLF